MVVSFCGFEGGKAVVRAVVALFNTVLGDETPFHSSLVVFEDNGVTLVNRWCSVVFVFLGLSANPLSVTENPDRSMVALNSL